MDEKNQNLSFFIPKIIILTFFQSKHEKKNYEPSKLISNNETQLIFIDT
jgi:hypothetical protein